MRVFMHLYKLYFSAAWGQGSPQARQCLQMSPGEFLRRDKSKIKPAPGTCAICAICQFVQFVNKLAPVQFVQFVNKVGRVQLCQRCWTSAS